MTVGRSISSSYRLSASLVSIAAVNGVEAGRFLACFPCNAREVCWEGFLLSTSGLATGWASLGTSSSSLSRMEQHSMGHKQQA